MKTHQPTSHETNVATAAHIGTFLKYLFPFGNLILPVLLWVLHKEKPFIAEHARQSLNFQLSIFIYSIIIAILCLPFFIIFALDFVALMENLDHTIQSTDFQNIKNLSGYFILIGIVVLIYSMIFIIELYFVISASLKASRGENYTYPMTIAFIKREDTSPIYSKTQPKKQNL